MTTLKELLSRVSAVSVAASCLPALLQPPTAWAEDVVTYEVFSETVRLANVEYQTTAGRMAMESVALPWRMETPVHSVAGPPPDGSQVRADWRPVAAPRRWVSVRIIHQERVICQSTLDIGNATCYGITRRIT